MFLFDIALSVTHFTHSLTHFNLSAQGRTSLNGGEPRPLSEIPVYGSQYPSDGRYWPLCAIVPSLTESSKS